jgi:hypothetical protein
VRATPHSEQAVNRSTVNDAASKLAQLALRDEVLYLSRGDAETLGGLGDGEEPHDS